MIADNRIPEQATWDFQALKSNFSALIEIGSHSILCADAQLSASYRELMGNDIAQMSDFPYNVKISGHAMGRGKIRHREFKMASGEISDDQFAHFLASIIRNLIDFSVNGSIHYLFMDWRHLLLLLLVAQQ